MDKITSRAIDYIADHPDLCKALAEDTARYRQENADASLDKIATFMYESFLKATVDGNESLFVKANLMNVVLAIAESSGYEF